MGTASLRIPGAWLLGLFALSGAAGLVYQSIWAHYLGLVLGHAAYAQTLVLGLFMGGLMAVLTKCLIDATVWYARLHYRVLKPALDPQPVYQA